MAAPPVSPPEGKATQVESGDVDYYNTLTPRRMAKNAPLETVGELLLVKGFSREFVYGGTLKVAGEDVLVAGLSDLLTVYGDGRVNVNAAEPRVLVTLPLNDNPDWPLFISEEQGSPAPASGRRRARCS